MEQVRVKVKYIRRTSGEFSITQLWNNDLIWQTIILKNINENRSNIKKMQFIDRSDATNVYTINLKCLHHATR